MLGVPAQASRLPRAFGHKPHLPLGIFPLRRRSIIILALLVVVIASAVAADWWVALPVGIQPTFVGRQSCAQCHQQELKLWTGSDHDLAMDLATPDTVIGDFNNVDFEHLGVHTRFERDGDRYFVTTEGPTGKQEKFEVKYTFGVRPLQQYMVEFPDGRVQVLSVCWDTVNKKWFDLHTHERMEPDDWLHWTKGGSNWNYMCAECHSTDVHKNYDLAKDTYSTTWFEIDVSCEACHGPASTHIELANAKSLFWDRNHGYGLAKLKGAGDTQLETCARCHSHRRVVCGGYQANQHFYDHYEPRLIADGLYHVDGQILEEVYEFGSYEQSRMYREGVKCTNCHDPHSTRTKFTGNQLCLQCHTLSKGNYDSPSHHHHQPGSAGASCVECHMPVRKYMVVDPRRDHSIRVPRPDLTVKLGVPNACQNCHAKENETPQWAAAKVVEWYGPKRKDDPHYGEVFAAARTGAASALDNLISLTQRKGNRDQAKNVGPIVRASAASLLSNYSSAQTHRTLEKLLTDEDPLVRVTAAKLLGEARPQSEPEAREMIRLLVPLLNDPVRLVRSEAARLLTAAPQEMFSAAATSQFKKAFDEWRDGLQEVIDEAGTHMNLALAYENLGDRDRAKAEYLTALRLHPNEVPAMDIRANLAMLEHLAGRSNETERLYRECIVLGTRTLEKLGDELRSQPDNPTNIAAIASQKRRLAGVHFNLGLLLFDTFKKQVEGIAELRRAVDLDASNARFRFQLGHSLLTLGNFPEAEPELKQACALGPSMVDAWEALTQLYVATRRWPEALQSGAKLLALKPDFQPTFEQIRRQAQQRTSVGPQAP